MTKLLSNLCEKADKLWVRWLHAYYIKQANVMDCIPKSNCSWMFKVILKQRDRALQSVTWGCIRNGGKFPTSKYYHDLRGSNRR